MDDDVMTQRVITLEAARRVVVAAAQRAEAMGVRVSAVVVDRYGDLTASCRMDGGRTHTAEIARQKASTSSIVGMSTKAIWDLVKEEPARVTMLARVPDFLFLGGGVPIVVGGEVIGAIGVSGAASPEMDDEIATASLDALQPGLVPGVDG